MVTVLIKLFDKYANDKIKRASVIESGMMINELNEKRANESGSMEYGNQHQLQQLRQRQLQLQLQSPQLQARQSQQQPLPLRQASLFNTQNLFNIHKFHFNSSSSNSNLLLHPNFLRLQLLRVYHQAELDTMITKRNSCKLGRLFPNSVHH